MILKSSRVSRVVLLVRPGATEFDDQGRIKGSMDMPMSQRGREQVSSLAEQVAEFNVKTIYCAPCESARETAQRLAGDQGDIKIKVVDSRQVNPDLLVIDETKTKANIVRALKRGHKSFPGIEVEETFSLRVRKPRHQDDNG